LLIKRLTKIFFGYGVLISLLLLCFIIGFKNPVFLSLTNLTNVLIQATIISIIAVGMTFVIISGGIDLSVGSIVAFSGMILGYMLNSNYSVLISIIVCLLIGISFGFINGFLISFFKIPPFIATLGMMSVCRGFALMVNDGRSFSGFSDGFIYCKWCAIRNTIPNYFDVICFIHSISFFEIFLLGSIYICNRWE
jgi:ribose transport system permease protein